jgi:hypothetical protein
MPKASEILNGVEPKDELAGLITLTSPLPGQWPAVRFGGKRSVLTMRWQLSAPRPSCCRALMSRVVQARRRCLMRRLSRRLARLTGYSRNIAPTVASPSWDARTKRNHEVGFRMVGDHALKDGRRLGSIRATAIDTPLVNVLYENLLIVKEIDRGGNTIERERRTTVLLQENTQLEESRADEVARQVAAQMADKDAKIAAERVEKLKRIGEQRTPQRLGEIAERDQCAEDCAAVRQDYPRCQGRPGRGRHPHLRRRPQGIRRRAVGNQEHLAISEAYVTKLLDDQLKARMDWGVLVLGHAAFPAGCGGAL